VFMMWKAQFASVAEGRRFRLLTAGLAWGTIPMMATVFLQSVVPAFNSFMRQPPHLLWAGLVLYPLLLSVPIIAAYAVLVHKVLDIRLIIRKALQYAFARYSALTVAVAPVILLVAYMYSRRNETLIGFFTSGGTIALLGTSSLGLLVFVKRG